MFTSSPFRVERMKKDGATIVREDGYETTLVDKLPELEI